MVHIGFSRLNVGIKNKVVKSQGNSTGVYILLTIGYEQGAQNGKLSCDPHTGPFHLKFPPWA